MTTNDIVNELKVSNNLFNERYLARINEEAVKESVSAGELIKEGITNYRTLAAHTEAHATLTPGKAYKTLINQLNVLIDKYNSTVGTRSNDHASEEYTGLNHFLIPKKATCKKYMVAFRLRN